MSHDRHAISIQKYCGQGQSDQEIILRRIASSLRLQDWTTVFIELLIVVVGLLLGLQLNDWSNSLKDRKLAETHYDQLILDLEADVAAGEFGVQSSCSD
jgi:hypothetical protein